MKKGYYKNIKETKTVYTHTKIHCCVRFDNAINEAIMYLEILNAIGLISRNIYN